MELFSKHGSDWSDITQTNLDWTFCNPSFNPGPMSNQSVGRLDSSSLMQVNDLKVTYEDLEQLFQPSDDDDDGVSNLQRTRPWLQILHTNSMSAAQVTQKSQQIVCFLCWQLCEQRSCIGKGFLIYSTVVISYGNSNVSFLEVSLYHWDFFWNVDFVRIR